MWGGLIGLFGTAGVILLLRDYLLYIVRAGQIAVMVEVLSGGADRAVCYGLHAAGVL